jgi:hypothetical protein
MLVSPRGRPFVCDGSPLECRVFLVGANPATEMSRPFWDFWSDTNGFDKEAWFSQYLADRANAPLKPGKKRRNPISNTRQRLGWIIEEANPVSCLETNVFSEATETLAELGANQRTTHIFEFLVRKLTPILLVPHGKDARECIESLAGIALPENEIISTNVLGHSVKVLPVSHLSRGWSQAAARELGRKIGKLVANECT